MNRWCIFQFFSHFFDPFIHHQPVTPDPSLAIWFSGAKDDPLKVGRNKKSAMAKPALKRWRSDAGMGIRGFHRQHWPAIGGSNLGMAMGGPIWEDQPLPYCHGQSLPFLPFLPLKSWNSALVTLQNLLVVSKKGYTKKTPPSHGVVFIWEPPWLCHEWWHLCLHHLCPEVGLLWTNLAFPGFTWRSNSRPLVCRKKWDHWWDQKLGGKYGHLGK